MLANTICFSLSLYVQYILFFTVRIWRVNELKLVPLHISGECRLLYIISHVQLSAKICNIQSKMVVLPARERIKVRNTGIIDHRSFVRWKRNSIQSKCCIIFNCFAITTISFFGPIQTSSSRSIIIIIHMQIPIFFPKW